MPVCAVLGGQWGDEGKGKIVDVLAEKAHVTARFSGGNNAGHTVMNPGGTFKLHLVPSGIFWPDGISVIGNGVVVDPDALLEEIEGLRQRDIDLEGRLLVSDRCHLVMPYHVKLDELAEAATAPAAATTVRRRAAGDIDPADPATWGRVSRNAPCPCGSGKKYKRCHGRAA